MSKTLDQFFEGVLIYEGGVLAGRRAQVPAAHKLPLVSELVWASRRWRLWWVPPTFVALYLLDHFLRGGRADGV